MDVDRLAETAVELAQRVRTEDSATNAQWLTTVLDPSDINGLIFVQAAANPPSREGFARAVAWAQPTDIDDIAVERACQGDDVDLNPTEQRRVVEILARAGKLCDREIGQRAGLDPRSVQRIRAKLDIRRRRR